MVSVLEGGEPTVIPNAEGQRTNPSVRGVLEEGEILVARWPRRRRSPTRIARSGRSSARWETGHRNSTSTERRGARRDLRAHLMTLKADAEAYRGDKVAEAVVTRSRGTSTDAQRQATKEGARSPASKFFDHQRAYRGRARVRVWTRATASRPSWCPTRRRERSTSPSSSWRRRIRGQVLLGRHDLGGDDWTSASSTTRHDVSRTSTASPVRRQDGATAF